MRILQIISGFAIEGPLGGIERFGIEVSRKLRKMGLEPILCGMWSYGQPYEYEWVERLKSEGIEAFICAEWQESSPYNSFRRVVSDMNNRAGSYDIIHSHCQFGDILAFFLPNSRKTPKIRTVHNSYEWKKRPLRRVLLSNIVYPLRYDLEIGVSKHIEKKLNRRFLTKIGWAKPAQTIYNALNLNRFKELPDTRASLRASFGLPSDATVIATIGRITAQKAQTDLVLAVQALNQNRSEPVYCLIIGDGDQREMVNKQINDFGLVREVILTGPRKDIPFLLGGIDCFVSASHWEGVPTVIMESMMANVPVVATSIPGTNELVFDGNTGLLAPPGQPQALAQVIAKSLALSEGEKGQMTRAAQKLVYERFDIHQIAASYRSIYETLAEDAK